ncbi:MAG: hypothetical protein AAGJ08_22035 [Cyanobacteria bacterium P01_H01_bin.35]
MTLPNLILISSNTETTFDILPLNLPTVKITKIRYALSATLSTYVTEIFTSVIVCRIIF